MTKEHEIYYTREQAEHRQKIVKLHFQFHKYFVLIGAGWTRRSDWPEIGVCERSDR